MKILIAYDGSKSANAALADLKRAGLPADALALVLSVADVWLPPHDGTDKERIPEETPRFIKKARQQAIHQLEQARQQAETAVQQLQTYFPGWTISAESVTDSPGWAIVKRAEEWGADLVVVGSQGHSALERVLIGSVSQAVLGHAHCTVRICRNPTPTADKPIRLLIGFDASRHMTSVLNEVCQRHWPAGSEVQLVAAIDNTLSTITPWGIGWLDNDPNEYYEDIESWMRQTMKQAVTQLRAAGLETKVQLEHGDPRSVLVRAAEAGQVDCIFVGARGLSGFERFMLGSVSSAVAARAHCSVEVVRR